MISIQDNILKSKMLAAEIEEFKKMGGKIEELPKGFSGELNKGWNSKGGLTTEQLQRKRKEELKKGIERRKKNRNGLVVMKAEKIELLQQRSKVINDFLAKGIMGLVELSKVSGVNLSSIRRSQHGTSEMSKEGWDKVQSTIIKLEKNHEEA